MSALLLPACDSSNNQTGAQDKVEMGFKPSGDVQKDAQIIADKTVELSRKMMEGSSSPDESQAEVDQMIKAASDHYKSQNRHEEFHDALNAATEVAVDSLAIMMGKGPGPR